MHGQRLLTSLTLMAGALAVGALPAQPPAKPPALPPIVPAQARLDLTISGLDGPGFAIASAEDRGMVAAACEGETVQIWNKDALLGIRSGTGTAQVLRGHAGPVTAVAWHGGPVLASAGGGKVILWSMATGKPLHTLPADKQVRALAMSPDGKLLAGAGDDPTIQLWEVATGKPSGSLPGHSDWVLALAFSPDSKRLASGGYDGIVRLWEMGAGKKLRDVPITPQPPPKGPADPVPVLSLAFSPDGKELAVGGVDGQVRLLGAADGKLLRALAGHTSAAAGLAYHPGGKVLASAGKDRTVRLWDPTNGQAIKSLEGHTAWAQGVVFFARGTRLASVGADQTVRVWDLTEPPKK
jgi:WD40 repeat protein